jgi:WS/DGAT/MGAT family acyltransferase
MWFLTGLPNGRIGFFMKVSHAIADGMAGVAALGAFVDVTPDSPEATSPSWMPGAMPSGRELLADNVRGHLQALDRAADRLAHPVELARAARRGWPAVHEAFFDGRAPSTSLNARPVSPDRRLVTIGGSLDLIKGIARAHHAKVNDVLLATIAGGFRDLLCARGEPVDGVLLRAMVPVSLHDGAADARGNRDGAMVVPLPVGGAAAAERLALIAEATAERKKKARPPGGTLFRNRVIQRAFLGITAHQRFFNTYVTNVPGPPVPLFFAGAQILEVFPLVPLIGNLSIGIGALSYTGQFNVTVVADRDLCPDLETFVEGIRGSLTVLEGSIRARAG